LSEHRYQCEAEKDVPGRKHHVLPGTVADLRKQILNCEHRLPPPVKRHTAETLNPLCGQNHIGSSEGLPMSPMTSATRIKAWPCIAFRTRMVDSYSRTTGAARAGRCESITLATRRLDGTVQQRFVRLKKWSSSPKPRERPGASIPQLHAANPVCRYSRSVRKFW
jgi:hypothetical protein